MLRLSVVRTRDRAKEQRGRVAALLVFAILLIVTSLAGPARETAARSVQSPLEGPGGSVAVAPNASRAALTAIQIEAGWSHNCARFSDGSVKCWGNNSSGQLGLGDSNNRGDNANEMGDNLPFVNLGTGRTAVELTAGFDFTCARLDTNAVKCWGNNGSGRLGLGDQNNRGDAPNEMGNLLPEVNLGSGLTAFHLSSGLGHT